MAGIVLLVAALIALVVAWRLLGPNPLITVAAVACAAAGIFCLLVAIGYIDLDISWVSNPNGLPADLEEGITPTE